MARPGKAVALRIYRFPCSSGEILNSHVYIRHSAAEGVQPIAFAWPDFEVSCANGATPPPRVVCTFRIVGYGTHIAITNTTFDPETGAVSACRYWLPGPCADPSVWVLRDGRYVLSVFEGQPVADERRDPVWVQ